MIIVGLAALFAFANAALGLLFDLASTKGKTTKAEELRMTSTFGTAGVTFIVLFFLNWIWIYNAPPIFAGAAWVPIIVFDLIVTAVLFGLANAGTKRKSAAPFVAAGLALFLTLGVAGLWNYWFLGQGNVDKLKGELKIEMIAVDKNNPKRDTPEETYPETDENHMVIVDEQVARSRANDLMNTRSDGQGIGTRLDLSDGIIQLVQGHAYWIFELRPKGWTETSQLKYTVPGFIFVDAENPDGPRDVKLGYKIKYWPGGSFGSSLERLVWGKGYRDQFHSGNYTLEVDDNWNPYFTATLDTPEVRWHQSIPREFLLIDPQTGKVTKFALNEIPSWIDRVYSESHANYLLEAWGHWGQAPYKYINEKAPNRYKLSGGGLNFVVTKDGPAWQAIFTSWKSDTAVQYVALMDTRSNRVRVYASPAGLKVESDVETAFNKSPNNVSKLDPVHLTLHKIYGQLTWVASLVGNDEGGQEGDNGYPKATTSAGTGILNATSSNTGRVIIGRDKGDALSQYRTQIATGSDNGNPSTQAQTKTITGKVAAVSNPMTINKATTIILRLEGDNSHIYQAVVVESQPSSLTLAVTKPGDEVTLTYVDVNSPVLTVTAFTNNSLIGVK